MFRILTILSQFRVGSRDGVAKKIFWTSYKYYLSTKMLIEHLRLPLRLRLACRSTWLFPTEFVPRWNSTATQLHDGPPVTDTNRICHFTSLFRFGLTISNTGAEATQKRFWKEVGIEKRGDSLTITLDKRALKTPSGQPLLLPLNKTLPAALIAAEWDNQEVLLKPHALPMVMQSLT